MMITSFLDSFEEARKTARERQFEKEANVFQGEGEKARSLLETYKEEQKQFEQNQQRKRNAKNEIFKHIVITDAITLETDKSDILSIPLTYMVIIPDSDCDKNIRKKNTVYCLAITLNANI